MSDTASAYPVLKPQKDLAEFGRTELELKKRKAYSLIRATL
jgi:hypothetical protein